jgi:16S rRNA (guanine966-N2)-methyltransferase
MPTIRIIAGTFGGRKIEAPPANNRRTHPMGERIRNAIFNSVSVRVQGATVLDAFAGTGAVGLEALSRGAKEVVFVERDKLAQRILSGNLELLRVNADTTLVKTTVNNWLEKNVGLLLFDLVFADPPYGDPQVETVERLSKVLAQGGLMVVSWPQTSELPILPELTLLSEKTYAGAKILTYERPELSTKS